MCLCGLNFCKGEVWLVSGVWSDGQWDWVCLCVRWSGVMKQWGNGIFCIINIPLFSLCHDRFYEHKKSSQPNTMYYIVLKCSQSQESENSLAASGRFVLPSKFTTYKLKVASPLSITNTDNNVESKILYDVMSGCCFLFCFVLVFFCCCFGGVL
jgi:hypothetical protein